MVSLSYFLLAAGITLLACLVVMALQARFFYQREDRWRQREQELRDQLWVLSGGKKPVVKYEHEKIVKVPDPEGQPAAPMNAWDVALFQDDVKEEVEQIHPVARGMSVAQVRAKWPHEWQQVEKALRDERAPLRAS
jgi:hypothetical protein